MTRYTPQWLQSGSYGASQDRRLIGALWPGPASSGCAVSPASAMTVNVAAGSVAVPTQNNTGSTLCSSDAVETVTLTSAPASGTNRVDLIICHPRGADLDGGGNNDFIFDLVTGVAAASPTVPATSPGTVALAQIYVPGGSAAVTAGNITDVRPGGLALSGAATQPPYTGAGVGTFTDPGGEVWIAKVGVYGGGWRKARDVVRCRYYRAAAYTIPAGANSVYAYDTASFDPYGLYVAGAFTVPAVGAYRLACSAYVASTASGQGLNMAFLRNGARVSFVSTSASTTTGQGLQTIYTDEVMCAVGDQLQAACWIYNTAVAASQLGNGGAHFMGVEYVGTG